MKNKKKITLLTLFIIIVISLLGCADTDSSYPKIEITTTGWRDDDVNIPIGGNYKLSDYDRVQNDDGSLDITIHFDKVEV